MNIKALKKLTINKFYTIFIVNVYEKDVDGDSRLI